VVPAVLKDSSLIVFLLTPRVESFVNLYDNRIYNLGVLPPN